MLHFFFILPGDPYFNAAFIQWLTPRALIVCAIFVILALLMAIEECYRK